MGSGARVVAACERNGALTYRSVLLVNADNKGLHSVEDLQVPGLRVAWSDPHSASGHIFPRAHLVSRGIDPSILEEKFVGSPLNACAAVAEGRADFCACFVTEASAADSALILADVRRVYSAAPWRLRVLGITDPIPCDALLVTAHVDRLLRTRITNALFNLHNDDDGRDALTKLLFAEKLVQPPPSLMGQIEAVRPHLPPL
jgi:ABC-type phosphate/phosphonate transport system substrate-binding protein